MVQAQWLALSKERCLFSGHQNCHQITSDTTIEFAISEGLKAPNVVAWAEASHASEGPGKIRSATLKREKELRRPDVSPFQGSGLLVTENLGLRSQRSLQPRL